MNRKTFLQSLLTLPLIGKSMDLNALKLISSSFGNSDKLPVLFVGHGNPMNAITDNGFSKTWEEIGKKLPAPKAILCISAHWLTNGGTSVTLADKPKTIHDFGGFPDELFAVQYPAPGAKDYAQLTIDTVKSTQVHGDLEWGLDHGTWSVLRRMYPLANIPVFQMSIDYGKPMDYHFKLASELAGLRKKGVLIIASGNVVHNLGMISWNDPNHKFDWAIEFDDLVKTSIEQDHPQALIDYQKLGKIASMAHPSNDHYIPLLYALGLREKSDAFEFFNSEIEFGSLSMRSVIFS